MEYVILFRNPGNGLVGFITDVNGDPTIFKSREAARNLARDHPLLRAWPHQLVSLSI